MKRLILKRISKSPHVTFGALLDAVTGLPITLTLENPWRGNEPSVSCIPDGVYVCDPYTSEKFPGVFQVMDVPGRTKILIHAGNTVSNTEGCILPGMVLGEHKGAPAVLDSRTALSIVKSAVNNESFILEVVSSA